jgi:hypothetical protein
LAEIYLYLLLSRYDVAATSSCCDLLISALNRTRGKYFNKSDAQLEKLETYLNVRSQYSVSTSFASMLSPSVRRT